MNKLLVTLAAVASMGAVATAQESRPVFTLEEAAWKDVEQTSLLAIDRSSELPRTLAEPILTEPAPAEGEGGAPRVP